MRDDTNENGGATDRRRFLKILGAVGVTGLAGCGGDGDDTEEPTGTDPTDTPQPTGTDPMDTSRQTGTDPMDTPQSTGTDPMDTPQQTGTDPTDTTQSTGTPTPGPEEPIGPNPATLLEFDTDLQAAPGSTVTLTGTVTNPYLFDIHDGEITMEATGDASVSPVSGTTFGTLATQGSQAAEWEVTVPDSAQGEIELTANVTYETNTDSADVTLTKSLVVVGPVPMPFGINAGGVGGSNETVEIDGVEFLPYSGEPGMGQEPPHPSVELLYEEGMDPHTPSGANGEGYSVEGGPDGVYNTMMWGDNIGYEIPVAPGTYEVTIHLAEIYFGSGSAGCDPCTGQRIQNVSVQGETVLEELDLVAEVGPLTALAETVEVETGGEPILIESEGQVAGAEDEHSMFNAIEIHEA